MKRNMILTIILAYLILLWDCEITITNTDYITEIEYNGLFWVALDYWSIYKYHSDDEPMKWLDWKRNAL
jgi:hypothetical protein